MGYAIYCRISRDVTGQGSGIDRQELECRNFAETNNLPVDEIYTDNDISAYSGKTRPAYRAMIERLKTGAHEGVIVWHVDRLYRRVRDLEELVELVEKTTITIRTVQAGDIDLNTATGRVVARLVAALANYEVEHMVERVLLSQRSRAIEGKYRGGYVPYGYRLGETPGTLEVDPDTGPIVQEMARRILAGEPVLAISKDLNKRNIPTQNGKEWRASTVRRTVRKPSIAGLSVHNGAVVGTAQWEPLISEEDWRTIDAILSDPSRLNHQGNLKRWQGAGVYECGKCGGKMVTAKQRGVKGSGRSYECGQCHGVSRNLDQVDALIDQVVLTYLDDPVNRVRLANSDARDGAELGELTEERRQLEAKRVRLGSLFASGAIDEDQLVAGTDDLRAKLERIDDRLVSLRATSPAAEVVLAGDDLVERWGLMSADMRGRVIDDLMRVTILPAGRGKWKFDPSLIRIEPRS